MLTSFCKSCLKTAVILSSFAAVAAHAYTFTGAYLGINGGYGWGNSHAPTTVDFINGGYFATIDIPQVNSAGSANLTLNNYTAGIQGGYNYQVGNGLIGIEADINSLGTSKTKTETVIYEGAPESTFTVSTKVQTNWLFTLRPRIGYVTSNCTLFYLTGGLALTNIKMNDTFYDDFALLPGPIPSNAYSNVSQSKTRTGGVFGAGVEYPIMRNLTIKAEYLYATFRNVSADSALQLNPAYLVAANVTKVNTFHHQADFSTNIFRLGINYLF